LSLVLNSESFPYKYKNLFANKYLSDNYVYSIKYNLLKSIKKNSLIGSVDANRRKWTRNKIAINIM